VKSVPADPLRSNAYWLSTVTNACAFGAIDFRNSCSVVASVSSGTMRSGVMPPPPYTVRPASELYFGRWRFSASV
jgi:hypothetical protein